MVSTTSLSITVSKTQNNHYEPNKRAKQSHIINWNEIPLLPLSNIVSRLHSNTEKHPLLSVCRNWTQLTVNNPFLWRKFELTIEKCSRPRQYFRTKRFLKQFGTFVKDLHISGQDKNRRYYDAMKSFIINLNISLVELERQQAQLTSLTIADLANHVSRSLTSDFSQMPTGWAQGRKLTRDFTKYSEVFGNIICRLGKSNVYKHSVKRLCLRNTRFENRQGVELLDHLVLTGMQLEELDLTAYFIYFHHLTDSARDRFQWITFGRIQSVTTLRIDHNIVDNLFLDTIADVWSGSLSNFYIEVQDSYRNCRYSNYLTHRSDSLYWERFNQACNECKVHFAIGGRRPNGFRADSFCDQDDNYLSTVIIASRCKKIASLKFIRTDYNKFVENVNTGYECMSPQYRHFQTYKSSKMCHFIKLLRLKPSLTATLKNLTIDSVDPLPQAADQFREAFMKFFNKENVLETLSINTIFHVELIDDIFSRIQSGETCLTHLDLSFVHYGDEPIDPTPILQKWSTTTASLQHFNFNISHRAEIDEDSDPSAYNDRVFQEWRRQLNLEIVDLTNDID